MSASNSSSVQLRSKNARIAAGSHRGGASRPLALALAHVAAQMLAMARSPARTRALPVAQAASLTPTPASAARTAELRAQRAEPRAQPALARAGDGTSAAASAGAVAALGSGRQCAPQSHAPPELSWPTPASRSGVRSPCYCYCCCCCCCCRCCCCGCKSRSLALGVLVRARARRVAIAARSPAPRHGLPGCSAAAAANAAPAENAASYEAG